MNKPSALELSAPKTAGTAAKGLKILLVLPAGERVRVTKENPQVPRRAMLRFSVLPLTVVAALTPPEHQVQLVDENVEPLDFDADCDLVGLSFMTALAPRAYAIAAQFRRRGKGVVAGGYHATLCHQEVARHFDAVVVGDAEGAWERLLEDFRSGALKTLYGQRVWSGSSAAVAPPAAPPTPVPRRQLLERTARHYATVNAVQAGRGCLHNCRYCSVTIFHQRTYHRRPLADLMAELRELPRNFIFVDDNLIADRDYALELFRAMRPLRKRWVGQCSVLIADDPELLELARAAGCRGLFIGIETVAKANLAAMNKQFNHASTYAPRLRRIHRAGIGVVAGMIVGMDGDTVAVFQQTLRFLRRTGIDAVQLNILTPLPGTPLFADMEAARRITDRDWSHYDYRHVVFHPAGLSAQDLEAGADWVYSQFYRLDRILWRFLRGLFTVGWMAALLGLKLGLTYRYDNRREGIVGWDPAKTIRRPNPPARPSRPACVSEARRYARAGEHFHTYGVAADQFDRD